MAKRSTLFAAVIALVASVMMFAGGAERSATAVEASSASASRNHDQAADQEAHGTTAIDVAGMPSAMMDPPPGGWPVPSQRGYYLTASCQPYASAIRRGAAAWQGLTEGYGTPVECRNNYIYDCGGGGRIVGCNWGRGQRIALFMGGVSDDALLAAHEFGHDWYGHSGYRCAGWSSPSHVMAPSICNFRGSVLIDR